jgi:hypothetical protein
MQMTDADKARAIAKQAERLAAVLERTKGRHGQTAQFYLLHLCNDIIDLIDDGNALAQRETLMHELQCDEEGNPVDEDGFPLTSFDPGSIHPDDPCKPKGYWA